MMRRNVFLTAWCIGKSVCEGARGSLRVLRAQIGAGHCLNEQRKSWSVPHYYDYLDGEDGNDTLEGQGGNDTLFGGTGDDQLAADGFDALAGLDSNGDGKISSADAQFNNLRIWRDLNQDGISQSGELYTLANLNIATINVAKTAHSQTLANENQIADLGTYTRICEAMNIEDWRVVA